jgi:hypothetical protein
LTVGPDEPGRHVRSRAAAHDQRGVEPFLEGRPDVGLADVLAQLFTEPRLDGLVAELSPQLVVRDAVDREQAVELLLPADLLDERRPLLGEILLGDIDRLVFSYEAQDLATDEVREHLTPQLPVRRVALAALKSARHLRCLGLL